jgi:hypothetical protein
MMLFGYGALYCLLILAILVPSSLFFFLKVGLAIWGIL